jgi:hypothetical protein
MIDRFTRRTLSAALVSAALALSAAPLARADDGPPPPPPPIPLAPDGSVIDGVAGALPPSTFADVPGAAFAVPVGGEGAVAPPAPAPLPPGGAPGTQPGPLPPPATDVSPNPLLDPASLRELVGKIALYPDVVLGSLLPAATSPLDVLEAAALVKANGGRVAAVPANSGWEPAVQAMLQYPDALTAMAADLGWLRNLGAAVEADQDAVLAAIQAFRADVSQAGNLKTSPQVVVTTQPAPAPNCDPVIVIEPATPTVVYVPVYDPVVVCRPSYTPWSLYSWGIGTDCGPYGPWGWSYLSWGFSWSWYYGGHGHYHGGHHPYGHYRPRHSGADVVGYSANYGPAVIRHSRHVGYHSTLRTSATASVFQPRSVRTGSSAYSPRAQRSGTSTFSTQGQGQSTRSRAYGPNTAAGGGTVVGPRGTDGATTYGTQFRRQGGAGGTDATLRRGGNGTGVTAQDGATTTRAPRTHYTPRGASVPPTVSTPGTPTTRAFTPQAQPRNFQPQVQPRSHQPQIQPRSYQPQVQPRSFQPQVQPRSFQPQVQPRSFQPQTPSQPRFFAPQRSSGASIFSGSHAGSWGRSSNPSPRVFAPSSGGGGSRRHRR